MQKFETISPTSDDIFEDIKKLNIVAVNGTLNTLKAKQSSLAVDGTCCTGKSTLKKWLSGYNIEMKKVNNMYQSGFIDSSIGHGLGYVYKSLKTFHSNYRTVFDRSPENNLDWCTLWKVFQFDYFRNQMESSNLELAKYQNQQVPGQFSEMYIDLLTNLRTNGKSVYEKLRSVDYEQYVDLVTSVDIMFKYLEDYMFRDMGNRSPRIYIICSNENYLRHRMLRRGFDTGSSSDYVRATWPFYLTLQNQFYAQMAFRTNSPIIDINRYLAQRVPEHEISQGIAKFIKYLFDQAGIVHKTENSILQHQYISPSVLKDQKQHNLPLGIFKQNQMLKLGKRIYEQIQP